MKRLHLIEIEDQPWCPAGIRDSVTDYLQFIMKAARPYAPMAPILAAALRRTGERQVVDLCSGGAGPWHWLHPVLAEMGLELKICLTDKYPNVAAFNQSLRISDNAIFHHPKPVEATRVPPQLKGFRTLFTSFHHFAAPEARAVLADAVASRQSIGIFEVTGLRLMPLLAVLVLPLLALVLTPFIRPFRWSRLLWTYFLPVAPMVALFDGLVSLLRTYSPEQLRELVSSLGSNDYSWEIGVAQGRVTQLAVFYLIGIPGGAMGSAPLLPLSSAGANTDRPATR